MFLGEFRHAVDEKGRVIMPAKFRSALADGLVITKAMEPCLQVYSRRDWPEIESKIRSLPITKSDARKIQRLIFGGATEDKLTKQGRVSIPQHLREYAQLDREIVIVGLSNRLEIWAKENWEKHIQDAETSFADIAEELSNLGI